MRTTSALGAYGRSLADLRRWLSETITFEEAKARVTRRLETREESFLGLMRRCVFGNPKSPYLPLLRQAHCEYEDLTHGVQRRGIESELRRLKDAGVWVSLEEFKGRTPIVRGSVELRQSASDFDNPVVSPIVSYGSGGSSGRSVRSVMDLDQLAVKATYEAFLLKLADLYGAPQAAWYPQLPAGSGIVRSLVYAKLGMPLARWFDIEYRSRNWSGWQGRLLTAGLVAAARLSGQRLALPEPGPLHAVLRWVLGTRDRMGRCALQTYPSRAARLGQAARSRGRSLEGVTCCVAGEPLSPVRHDEIRATGARVFPFYTASETGTIAVGCADPQEPGDHHLCHDLIAITEGDGANARSPSMLHLTSLHEASPKVMVNTQLGDCARVVRRRCACALGEIGLDVHLLQVHSVGRVTCEGMTVPVSDLLRMVDEVLRPRYGGSSLDYQWAEQEDRRGKGQLLLRVGPAVGPVDPPRMACDVLDGLAGLSQTGRIVAAAWREAGTVAIVREQPRQTVAGKTLPFMREAPS